MNSTTRQCFRVWLHQKEMNLGLEKTETRGLGDPIACYVGRTGKKKSTPRQTGYFCWANQSRKERPIKKFFCCRSGEKGDKNSTKVQAMAISIWKKRHCVRKQVRLSSYSPEICPCQWRLSWNKWSVPLPSYQEFEIKRKSLVWSIVIRWPNELDAIMYFMAKSFGFDHWEERQSTAQKIHHTKVEQLWSKQRMEFASFISSGKNTSKRSVAVPNLPWQRCERLRRFVVVFANPETVFQRSLYTPWKLRSLTTGPWKKPETGVLE